jgi:hypothetical protein
MYILIDDRQLGLGLLRLKVQHLLSTFLDDLELPTRECSDISRK